MDSRSQKALLSTETDSSICYGVTIREVKMMDQFAPDFKDLIKRFSTSEFICGYVASGVAPFVAKNMKTEMEDTEVDSILNQLSKDSKEVCSLIEETMSLIQGHRQDYINENKSSFKTKQDEDKYLAEWVFNFEISDTLRATSSDLSNLFFLRYCGWDVPDLATKAEHEEAKRIEEEKPYKGQTLFIEVFSPERKLMSIEDFIKERRDLIIFAEDKPMVFLTDIVEHFVTFIALKVKKDQKFVQETVLMLDSTTNNYLTSLKGSATAKKVAQMAFPDTYDFYSKY